MLKNKLSGTLILTDTLSETFNRFGMAFSVFCINFVNSLLQLNSINSSNGEQYYKKNYRHWSTLLMVLILFLMCFYFTWKTCF